MKDRSRTHRDNLIRFSFWGTLILIAVLVYLHANPIQLEAENPEMPGSTVSLEAVSDVLLVVDYDAFPTQPEAFADLDFSLAWLNTLQQEVGPVVVQDADTFPDTELAPYRFVIVSRSAAGNEAWIQKLQGFVDRGGTLLLEMPTGALREKFSADGEGGERNPQHITMANGLSDELLGALMEIPLVSKLVGSAGPLADSETLMTIDGVPVVYRKQHSKGWAITVDFDYGMLLTAVQQGRPTDGFRLRDQRGTDTIETADLAVSEALMDAEIPIADVLERFMVYGVLGSSSPVVGFWPFLDGMDGAYVVSHDERGVGDATSWMAEYEHSFSGSSSYFLRADGKTTETGLESLVSYGIDVGLEWQRLGFSSSGAFKHMGVLGVEPVARELSLVEQLETLTELYPDLPKPETVRTSGHSWDRDWASPFRAMSAAELRADASYAPLPGVVGYPFGTGLPFMPLDSTGLAFQLLEFPMTLVSRGSDDELERLTLLLQNSQERDHQAIGVSFSPADFSDAPNVKLFQAWRNGYALAAERGHWVTSIHNMYRFQRARHNSELTSKLIRKGEGEEETYILKVEILSLEKDMTCTAPSNLGTKQLKEVRRGVNRATGDELRDVLETRTVNVMGFERVLIPLNEGYNAIDIEYQ